MTSTDVYTRLFPAFDGGHFDLPPEVITARDAYDRLDALPVPAAADYWQVRQDLIAATMEAALSGADHLPDCTGIDEARRAAQVHTDTHDVRRETLDALKARVLSSVNPAEVLTKYLAPAHDETVTELRNAWQLVDAHYAKGGSPYAMPKGTATAAQSVDGLITRYEAIRFARGDLAIRCHYQPEVDADGEFSVISNPEELWTRPRHRNITGGRAPWAGMGTTERLRYLLANGGKVWLPTPAQQDGRFRTVYAQEMAQAAEQRERERVFATNNAGA